MYRSILITLFCVMVHVHGHGRLMNPPNRGSLWRVGYNSPANYDDDGLNCGGFHQQHSVNNGRCGICGDAYDLRAPRAHELGGQYGLGYIVANYQPGQLISTNVYLSASHLGYWELRICPDPTYQEQECFDNGYILEMEDGETKFYPLRGSGTYEANYRLPAGLTCEHCVLQWRYTAGNNWGVCANGSGALGCGNQEQFYSCSDISIGGFSEDNHVTNEAQTSSKVTDAQTTSVKVTDPVYSTSPILDGITHDFVNLNAIELELLKRRLELAGYRIFTEDAPVISKNSVKKYKNKHRRKKNNKRKAKRHKKVFFWR